MNDSVDSDALVMPSSSGSPMAGLAARVDAPLVLLLEDVLLDLLVDEEVGVAHVLDAHAAQHLPNDDLDVLVVDLHALEAVDLLDLVDQVLRELLLAEHPQDVVRVGRRRPSAARRRARGRPRCTLMCLPLGIRYSRAARPDLGRDDDLALALGVLAEATPCRRSRR